MKPRTRRIEDTLKTSTASHRNKVGLPTQQQDVNSPIGSALSRVDAALSRAEDSLGDLYAKLNPILSPEPEGGEGGARVHGDSAIHERILSVEDRIEAINASIKVLQSRVTL